MTASTIGSLMGKVRRALYGALCVLFVTQCGSALADASRLGAPLFRSASAIKVETPAAPFATTPSPTLAPTAPTVPSPVPTATVTPTPRSIAASPTPTVPSPVPTATPTPRPTMVLTMPAVPTALPTATVTPTTAPTTTITPALTPTATIITSLPPTIVPAGDDAPPSILRQGGTRYAVDFSYLRRLADNSVAWLYQPGTTINQPVMLTDSNSYYLRNQYTNQRNEHGALFMKGTQDPDFTAPCVTIYGRNCSDCTMFGSLSYYKDDAYYRAHPTLILLTPVGDYQLDIFAGVYTTSNDDGWSVSGDAAASLYDRELPRILDESFITPDPALLPTREDAWAVLAAQPFNGQKTRYVLYARKRPLVYQKTSVAYVNQLEMDARDTKNGRAYVLGVGSWMLYAQNDPLWDRLRFEASGSGKKRPFGDGGCGPTAVAMAIANLVDQNELRKLGDYASSSLGYRFCSCSVNQYGCSGAHLPYRITTDEAYLRYFPLAVAGFATGNNAFGVRGRSSSFGTNMSYLRELCSVYGITVTQTSSLDKAMTFLSRENTIAITCTVGKHSPFTSRSHFVVLAHVKDGYLYVLDPLRRESYAGTDTKGRLEILTPGLVRLKAENASKCGFHPIYLLERGSDAPPAGEESAPIVP